MWVVIIDNLPGSIRSTSCSMHFKKTILSICTDALIVYTLLMFVCRPRHHLCIFQCKPMVLSLKRCIYLCTSFDVRIFYFGTLYLYFDYYNTTAFIGTLYLYFDYYNTIVFICDIYFKFVRSFLKFFLLFVWGFKNWVFAYILKFDLHETCRLLTVTGMYIFLSLKLAREIFKISHKMRYYTGNSAL